MGVYDEYGSGQLKVGHLSMRHFQVGDKVDIADGVYVTYANVVVVVDGIFIAEFEMLTDKWGMSIEPQTVLQLHNPLGEIVRAVVAEYSESE